MCSRQRETKSSPNILMLEEWIEDLQIFSYKTIRKRLNRHPHSINLAN